MTIRSQCIPDTTRYNNHIVTDPLVVAQAIAAYATGKSSTQVGKELDISSKTVLAYVHAAGGEVRPRRKYPKLTPEQKAVVESEFSTGEVSQNDLAQRFEVCRPTLTKHLKDAGIPCGVIPSNQRRKLSGDDRCLNSVYGTYRRDARKRNREFNLTKEQVKELIFAACHYCGRERANRGAVDHLQRITTYNGIDRMDSSKGHYPENVVTCCQDCNRAKSDKTLAVFHAWILLIAARIPDATCSSV